MQTRANGARLHPADRHWYLETMGVARGAQRQGVGGRLLEPVLEIADRDQVDCYLETAEPRNAEYYARHGFVVENPAPAAGVGWPGSHHHAAPPDCGAGMRDEPRPRRRKQPMETAAQIQ